MTGLFTYARILGFIPLFVFAGILALGAPWIGSLGSKVAAWIALAVVCALVLFIAVRGCALRLYIEAGALNVRQWFAVTSIPLEEVRAVHTVSYQGYINGGGLGDLGTGGLTPMILIDRERAGERLLTDLPATITPYWAADAKAARLRRAIASARGSEVSAVDPDSANGST